MNYNKTKYLAEQEVHRAVKNGLDVVILNPCNMMGPYDPKGWSTLIVTMVEEKVPGVTMGVATFAHVRDVARAHIKAAESGRRGENYLLGGVEIRFKEVYQEINELLHKNVKLRRIPFPIFRLAMYMIRLKAFLKKEEPILTYPRYKRLTGRIVCDDTKARKELSFSTTTMKEMLQDSYTWLLKEGIIEGKV
jgi:nucleoside-diphosphate-sugar epimerase